MTTLVSIPLDQSAVGSGQSAVRSGQSAGEIIASGYDFYSTPRLSPDGSRLAWLSWRHPQMPWDGTELWVAAVSDTGTLVDRSWLPAARTNRFTSRAGRRTACCTSPAIMPDGGP